MTPTNPRWLLHGHMQRIVMACVVMGYKGAAYIVMACVVMAYIGAACIVMACVVMAYIGMALIGMAYIAKIHRFWPI